jgi:leucyl-tRNA synthetase
MAYYTLAKTIDERNVKAKNLTDEVFDYVFFGKGDEKEISESSGLDKDIIEELRREFDYFYPVDLRTSGKDLVQNHLTFFIFHHVAIWDDASRYPKAIGVNGYVNVGGEKMSKSKGNFISLKALLKKHGADIVRINIVSSNENMDDADWREDSIPTYKSRINYLFELVADLKKAKGKKEGKIEKFLESRLQEIIQTSTEAYEQMKFRTAVQSALFGLTNEIKSYIDRVGGIKECNRKVLEKGVETLIRIVSPIIPHVSEELWSKMGKKQFVSTEKWPEPQPEKIDKRIMMLEETYKKTIEDIKQVEKLAKKKAKHLCLYFATDEELDYFQDSMNYLKRLGFEKISLFRSISPDIYDPQNKSKRAKFGKPGIYLE